MRYKMTNDGVSPFTGNRSVMFEKDDLIDDLKIICMDTGYCTFTKSQVSKDEFESLEKEQLFHPRYYDEKTGLIWNPDIQTLFVGEDAYCLTLKMFTEDAPAAPDFTKPIAWVICKAIQDEEFDTFYHPILTNVICEGSYTDCLDKYFFMVNTLENAD